MKKIILLLSFLVVATGILRAQNTNYGTGTGTLGTNNAFFGYFSGHSVTASGNYNAAAGYYSLEALTNGTGNAAFGNSALSLNTTGNSNTGIGYQALQVNVTGTGNTAVGTGSLHSNTGSANTAIGSNSLGANTSGNSNAALGIGSLASLTSGSNNVAVGYLAGGGVSGLTTASNGTFLGANATASSNYTNATAIGYNALVSANNAMALGGQGTNAISVGIGVAAPVATLDILGNIKIKDGTQGLGKILTSDANGLASWASAGSLTLPYWSLTGNSGTVDGTNFVGTTDNVPFTVRVNNQSSGRIDPTLSNSFWGYQAGLANTTGSGNTAVGARAILYGTSGTNNTAIGGAALEYVTTATENTGVGYAALNAVTTGFGNVGVGVNSLASTTTASNNTGVGTYALGANTTGAANTAIGQSVLVANTTGNYNVGSGAYVLTANTTGSYNVATGYLTLQSNSTGSFNTATGNYALYSNTASNNSAYGANALYSNTTGSSNAADGYQALYSNTTGGNNTALGYQAGYTVTPANANTTGSNNTFIGFNSGPGTSTQLSNSTAIGSYALVSASNSLVLGGQGANAVSVGVGVASPGATMDILGNIKIKDGTQGLGKVLTSDANGLASWTSPGAVGSWSTLGNAGTVDGTNFIGTTDNVPFTVRVNNTASGRIDHSLQNAFWGYGAGISNTTGSLNTAIGDGAMAANTSGYENVVVGSNALQVNTSGTNNVAIGSGLLQANVTGSANIAIGTFALNANTSSTNTAVGVASLEANTSGSGNTATGWSALQYNQIGSDNTAMGMGAGPSATGLSNTSSFGWDATPTASNTIVIGNTSITSIGGQVGWTTLSDGRYKNNIKEDVAGLEFIKQLRPVSYTINTDALDKATGAYQKKQDRLARNKNGQAPPVEASVPPTRWTGLIAQEVETSVKNSGYSFSGVVAPQNENDHYGLRYGDFVVPLIKAVQQLNTQLTTQQNKIDSLTTKINSLLNGQLIPGYTPPTPAGTQLALYQNYPNPFTKDTRVNMTIPETAQQASLIIYNLQGAQLKSIPVTGRGNVSVTINGGELTAGMYIYSLLIDNQVIDSKRMVLTN